jgi:phospholipase C
LPYELFVTDSRDAAGTTLTLRFEARKELFGDRAAGAPFAVYSRAGEFSCRHYAVEPGESVEGSWRLSDFDGGRYHLCAYGPNGFLREFVGGPADPAVSVALLPPQFGVKPTEAAVRIQAARALGAEQALILRDHSYGNPEQKIQIAPGATATGRIPVRASHGWYDFSVTAQGEVHFERRFAGRLETGTDGFSDPVISGPA